MRSNGIVRTVTVFLLVLVALAAAACGTLEIGVVGVADDNPTADTLARAANDAESSGPIIAPRTPTPVPDDWVPPTPALAFTPMPVADFPVPIGLRVCFIKDGDVWLWTAESRDARRLTRAGNVVPPLNVSDDGELVAFSRDGALWALATDGAGERLLLNLGDLSAQEPAETDATLNRFEWVPGTHTLAFNTRLRSSGRELADDLHLVNADNLQHTVLLPRGEGGEFYYSPDGSQIAIATTGDISLIDADGRQRRDSVLTYAPVAMYELDDYHVQPTWAADGSSLMVAIPPADPHALPVAPTTIWRISVSGGAAEHVTSVAAVAAAGAVFFSHDLQIAAFPELQSVDVGEGVVPNAGLKLLRLENGDWFGHADARFLGWAPNSLRFAIVSGRELSHLQVGQWSGPALRGPVDAGIPVEGFRWLDDDHYLLEARRDWEQGADGDSWDLILGHIDGSSAVLLQGAEEYIVYDLALERAHTSEAPPSTISAMCDIPTMSPPQLAAANDIPDWQTHHDRQRGFQIQYPSGWRLETSDDWVGAGPEELREDVLWEVRLSDSSDTTIEQLIDDVGRQFGSDRIETRECIRTDGLTGLKATVTTSKIVDWYAELVIFEGAGLLFTISNGAVRDERFEPFYRSFHLAGADSSVLV